MGKLGDKIRAIRLEKKLSQAEVAEAAEIARSTYNLIESGGKEEIFLKTAKGISKALDVPFTELFEIESSAKDLDKYSNEIGILKRKFVAAIDRYVTNFVFFRLMKIDPSDDNQRIINNNELKLLQEYRLGIFENIITLEICTPDELEEIFKELGIKLKINYKRLLD